MMRNYYTMLEQFQHLSNGTYSLSKEVLFHSSGYQVSFHEIGREYSEAEYDRLVSELQDITGSMPEIGRFGFEPHVSFWVEDEILAEEICHRFSQLAYWDWEKGVCRYVNSSHRSL